MPAATCLFIGLCDYVMLCICCSSTLTSECTCIFSLILAAATLSSFGLGKLLCFWVIPWRSALTDRAILERWRNVVAELTGQRAVLLYPVISVRNITRYRLAVQHMFPWSTEPLLSCGKPEVTSLNSNPAWWYRPMLSHCCRSNINNTSEDEVDMSWIRISF